MPIESYHDDEHQISAFNELRKPRKTSEGVTCYERDEELCEDQMCLRTGCRVRNRAMAAPPGREELAAIIDETPFLGVYDLPLRKAEALRKADLILSRLGTSGGAREATIDLCARVANRYRPNLMAKDIEQAIRALSRGGTKL